MADEYAALLKNATGTIVPPALNINVVDLNGSTKSNVIKIEMLYDTKPSL